MRFVEKNSSGVKQPADVRVVAPPVVMVEKTGKASNSSGDRTQYTQSVLSTDTRSIEQRKEDIRIREINRKKAALKDLKALLELG